MIRCVSYHGVNFDTICINDRRHFVSPICTDEGEAMIPLSQLACFKLAVPMIGQVAIVRVGQHAVQSNRAPILLTRLGYERIEFESHLSFPVTYRVMLQLSWQTASEKVTIGGYVDRKRDLKPCRYQYSLMLAEQEQHNPKLLSAIIQMANRQTKLMKQAGLTYQMIQDQKIGWIQPAANPPVGLQALGRTHWHPWPDAGHSSVYALTWPGGYLLFPLSSTYHPQWGSW